VAVAGSLLFNFIFPSIKGRKAVFWGIILTIPWILLFVII
jgi:hypothetical protein